MTTDTEQESSALGRSLDQPRKREYLWNIQTTTNSYVQFADTKAAFCVGIASAFVAALLTGKAQVLFLKSGPKNVLGFMSLGAFVFLGISLIAALMVVWPRPWKSSENKFVFWDGIAKGFHTAESFAAEFSSQANADLTLHLAHEVYDLATVCHRKYVWIDIATITAAGGAALAILTLLLKN
jgi:hypothetical protein